MKKHYETHVEDTDKLISVAGPVLDYKSWYEQYRKLMEEQAQRKYGLYTPTSEGDGDDFPSITGMIARYSALGLTNEQMTENPVWKDLTGNGHDLQMKNFSWKGMSGVGGYVGDFSKWVNNRDTTEIGITKSNSKVIIDVKVSQGSGKNIVFISKSNLGISNNVTIKITSTYPEGVMKFANSTSNKYLKLPSNGIITLQDNPEYTSNEMHLHLASADLGQITIEQLPLYPGALVFDGVDDYGTCNNFPILTKEKGYTVVALRQWITRGEIAQGLVSNVKNWLKDGAFLLEYRNIQADHLNKPISFGAIGSEMDLPHILTYQTSKSYNGVSITTGNFEGTDVLHVGKLAPTNVGTCINAAIWELVFLDHDATEEELTKIKDYFIKTYPWLFPDQAWTVTGKTNEDEDRATIANITGNGNDLVLSNFGFIEGSGYNEEGEYAGYLVTDGVDDIASSNTVVYEADFTFIGEWKFIQKDDTVAGINSVSHLYIQNRYNRGATVMINSTFENKKNITDYMTFKAITSKGKAYDENWNEVDLLYGDGNKGLSQVSIGGQGGSDFCHMIFKNMALYMNKVFSKDECIKAYNYLQTLKSK
jgi:hypothetical protein